MSGILYIISTPIGNLDDISYRALKILQKVDAIACEDTRKTGVLLKSLGEKRKIDNFLYKRPRFISYHDHNEHFKTGEIITALKNGLTIGLVSDAGTPLISDPGFLLIRECVKEGIAVEVIPGVSSVTAALSLSALPTDKFLFFGYPPRKEGHRKTSLQILHSMLEISGKKIPTVVFFEAPHRLLQFLEELKTEFGDIPIVICRELTKVHQEVRREKISQSIEHFVKNPPKGELVILFNLKV